MAEDGMLLRAIFDPGRALFISVPISTIGRDTGSTIVSSTDLGSTGIVAVGNSDHTRVFVAMQLAIPCGHLRIDHTLRCALA